MLWQAFFGHIAHERGFELDWRAVALVSGGLLLQMFLVERLGWIIATTLLFVAATLGLSRTSGGDQHRHRAGAERLDLSRSSTTGWACRLPLGTFIEDLLPATDEDAE